MLLLPAVAAAMLLDPSLSVVSTGPAKTFMESSPLGNGRIGAMLFGGVEHERVVLNESTMWSGSPQDADRADAYKVLPEIRRLLLADENKKAQDLLQRNFICKGAGSGSGSGKDVPYGCYQMFCNLLVDSPEKSFKNYRRVLDLDKAITAIGYDADDVHFSNEAFVSAPANVLAYRFGADRNGSVNLTIRLERPERATVQKDGNDLIISGSLLSGVPGVEGVKFEGRLRVVHDGGALGFEGNNCQIKAANTVTLLFSAGTSMSDPRFSEHAKARIESASKQGYEQLKAAHVRDYQSYFHRVSLRLPQGPSADKPTLDRLIAMKRGESDPSLAALYFNFGRYLLIGSSRPDSPLPANLQGIWAEEIQTPWNGDFHIDINVQMNYWLAEVGNLSDCHRPLLKFIQDLVPNGEKTAKAYYDAPGWVCHVISNPWHFTSPGEGAGWGSTCTGGGWLCEHLWDHYDYTRDRDYLKRAYPTMRGAAEFFLASLIEEPKHRWLVTAPSNSPENTYIHPKDGPLNTCMGPTMDEEIVRELFGNVIRASEILGVDDRLRKRLSDARARLAPLQIGKHGQLMEWLEDYDEAEVHHRHTSHLYALYPASEINAETPNLEDAARKTLERRGDMGTGWSLAWKVCFWARLHDGDHAWLILRRLLEPVGGAGFDYSNGGGTYPNLFDAHPPFQIDGNFGASAGIAEMLVQSDGRTIRLLPALPKAWASEGSVKGLQVRGGRTVDIAWKEGKVSSYQVHGANAKGAVVMVGSK